MMSAVRHCISCSELVRIRQALGKKKWRLGEKHSRKGKLLQMHNPPCSPRTGTRSDWMPPPRTTQPVVLPSVTPSTPAPWCLHNYRGFMGLVAIVLSISGGPRKRGNDCLCRPEDTFNLSLRCVSYGSSYSILGVF